MRLRRLKNHSIYPQIVKRDGLGLITKLKARINVTELEDGVFLGYCKIHREYFVDYKHIQNQIRCPRCDEAWLFKRGIE